MHVSEWTEVGDSAANAAQTLTRAAPNGRAHTVTAFQVTISGADAAADVTVELKTGTDTKWKTVIGSGSTRGETVGAVFSSPLVCGYEEAVTLEVSAGGADVVTSANLAGYT